MESTQTVLIALHHWSTKRDIRLCRTDESRYGFCAGRSDTAHLAPYCSKREVDVIDYYEASGVGLDHYVRVLKAKPYTYTNDSSWLPILWPYGTVREKTFGFPSADID